MEAIIEAFIDLLLNCGDDGVVDALDELKYTTGNNLNNPRVQAFDASELIKLREKLSYKAYTEKVASALMSKANETSKSGYESLRDTLVPCPNCGEQILL